MSDPRRTRDDPNAPAELRTLFARAQRTPPMSHEQRRRLRERIAVIAAVPVAASLLATTLKAMAAGAVVIAASAVVVVVAVRSPDTVQPASPRASAPSSRPAAEETAALEIAMPESAAIPAEEMAADDVAAPETDDATDLAPIARSPRRTAPEPTAEDPLAGETLLLARAQSALATDPARALAATREHERRFPRGQLAAERDFLAAQALLAMGQTRTAQARARRVIREHPSSIASARARAMLDGR
jgi:TolA-binding protein